MQPARRGFSLMELLVVLAIMVLLAAAVLPTIGPMRRQGRLRIGAAAVAGNLRSARSMAIAQSTTYSVGFETPADPQLHEVRIWSGGGSKTEFDRQDFLPEGVEVESVLPNSAIQFRPDGSAATSVTVTLVDGSGFRRRVTVSPASGRISLSGEQK